MRRRQGFTLVELLVALALIVFIMAILSEAFVASTKTFRDLKAAGDMSERLRSTTGLMRRYLSMDHFEGKRRLSDANFWAAGPPLNGFVRIWQGTPVGAGGNIDEGADLDGLHSFRSVNHMIHLAVKLRGNAPGEFFRADVPAGSPLLPLLALGLPESRFQDSKTYSGQWAEVIFFLRPVPDTANGTPLFALYMRQLVAVPDNGATQVTISPPPAVQPSDVVEVSGTLSAGTFSCNSPRDLTQPPRRFGMNPANPPLSNAAGVFPSPPVAPTPANTYPIYADQTTAPRFQGADLLLTDVVSFDVRVLVAGGSDFVDICTLGQSFNNMNPAFDPVNGPMVFDSWSGTRDDVWDYTNWQTAGAATSIPMWNATTQTGPILKAIQITLRVWDQKTEQTRQVTFEVPL